jgi:hypothetical protein
MDFLFNGQPPASTTQYGESFSNLPTWYSDYVKGMMSTAGGFAADEINNPNDYLYKGPRVAGLNPDQQNAFAQTRNGAFGYQPTLQAAQTAAQNGMQTFPGAAGQYMNPYTDQVVDRIGSLAQRNLTENLLPGVNQNFISAGQFGSSRNGEFAARAVRDANESALNAQSSALQQGYQQAGQMFDADQRRILQGGQQLGALATQDQNLALRGAGALSAIGDQQQQQTQRNLDVAYGDWQQQRDRPYDLLQQQSGLLRGINVPTSSTSTNTAPGTTFSPSPLAQLASAGLTFNGLSSR